jgi:hypothetical protein
VTSDSRNSPVNPGHESAEDQTAPGGHLADAADRDWALAGGFSRVDADPRPISEIPEVDLLASFGELG